MVATKKPTLSKNKVPAHPTFIVMVAHATRQLKYPHTTRPAIKKHILSKYKLSDNASVLLKNAIKKGVTMGYFTQPKGPSGPLKLDSSKCKSLLASTGSTPTSKSSSAQVHKKKAPALIKKSIASKKVPTKKSTTSSTSTPSHNHHLSSSATSKSSKLSKKPSASASAHKSAKTKSPSASSVKKNTPKPHTVTHKKTVSSKKSAHKHR